MGSEQVGVVRVAALEVSHALFVGIGVDEAAVVVVGEHGAQLENGNEVVARGGKAGAGCSFPAELVAGVMGGSKAFSRLKQHLPTMGQGHLRCEVHDILTLPSIRVFLQSFRQGRGLERSSAMAVAKP